MPDGEVQRRVDTLEEHRQQRMTDLLEEVGQGDFWTVQRTVQAKRLLGRKDAYRVPQTDIATVLGLTNARVTQLNRQLDDNPDEAPRRPGRPSELSDVFPNLEYFIDTERRAGRAVRMSVLMAFCVRPP